MTDLEQKLIFKIDWVIMLFACIMFMALELDRANIGEIPQELDSSRGSHSCIGQAVSGTFLEDLNLTTDGQYTPSSQSTNHSNTLKTIIWVILCSSLPFFAPNFLPSLSASG